jgi:HlyD family secretion protein
MAQTARMFVVAEVFETDIAHVQKGCKARIFGGPLSGQLTGEVQFVASYIQHNRLLEPDPAAAIDSRIIQVKILLVDRDAARHLIGAQVNVVIAPPGPNPL